MLTTHKIEKWIEAEAKLVHYKALETVLRREIADDLLEGKKTGTHNFSKLGYAIKAVKKTNTTIDRVALEALYDDFSEEEAKAIKFSPSLVTAKYNKLEHHDMIDHCLIVKPGMPTLSITKEEEDD